MDYSKTIRYVRLVFGRTLHLRSQDFTEPIVGDALYSGVLGQYDPSPYWKMPLYAIGGRYRWFKRNGWFRRWGTARYMFFASIAWWSVTILRVIGERRRALMYHAFARGFKSTLLSLGIVTVACVIALSYGLHVYRSLTGASEGIRSSMFAILYKLLNTGSIDDLGSSTPYALIMVAAIIAGITLMSTLIGIINNAITQRLDDVRTTNAPVALRNHIAIVGYSKDAIDAVFTSDTGRNVALLSGHDRQDMQEGEAEVRMLYINDKVRTRILYRFGLVMDHATLNLIQPQYAACTMILSADDVMDSRSIGAFTQLLKASVAPIYLELMSRSAFYLLPEHDRRRHAILVTEELESLSIKLIAEFGNRACDTLYMQEADETYALWDGIPLSPALVGKRLGDCAPRESVNGIPLGLIRGGLLITDYDTLLEATDRLCMIGVFVYSSRYNAKWQPGDTWLFKHKRVALRQRILCAVPNKESFITARAILQDSTLIVDYWEPLLTRFLAV